MNCRGAPGARQLIWAAGKDVRTSVGISLFVELWIASLTRICDLLICSLQKHTNILGSFSKPSYTCSSLGEEAMRKMGATGLDISEMVRGFGTIGR